jgi:hypothetical protein
MGLQENSYNYNHNNNTITDMSKIISIKLKRIGSNIGPFTIYDQHRNIIAEDVSVKDLIDGITYVVNDDVITVTLASTGKCTMEKTIPVTEIPKSQYFSTKAEISNSSCVWAHMKNPEINHSFYGVTEPYVIEYVFSSPNTEITQSISDYTRVLKYTKDLHGVSNEPSKIELDDSYFNKAIVYNDQQCSGVLNLVAKPKNDLRTYNLYPIYRNDSKDILYTKSGNMYKFNGFYDVVKDKSQFLFIRTCAPLSVDKEIHQENMVYANKSFGKHPIRSKFVKVRLILDNRSDIHMVSQFLIASTQISYK